MLWLLNFKRKEDKMVVRLKRYVIESTRSISGKVISSRYGYVISIRRHWWKVWRKPRYLCLLPGWHEDGANGRCVNVQLVKRITDATPFREGDVNDKAMAEKVIRAIKNQPEKFILS